MLVFLIIKAFRIILSSRITTTIILGGCTVGSSASRFLLDESLGSAPHTHDSGLCGRRSRARFFRYLILLICFGPGRIRLFGGPISVFGSALRGRNLGERYVLGLGTQFLPVEVSGGRVVFLVDWVAFLSIVAQELKEALIASHLDASDLERVPSLVEQGLDVALELREVALVHRHALTAEESAKSYVAVATSIVLTVNTEGVELLLIDAFAEVSSDVGSLGITAECGLG